MKYYYGNSYKEAVSNDPIEIRSIKKLQQYQENYTFVIAADSLWIQDMKKEVNKNARHHG